MHGSCRSIPSDMKFAVGNHSIFYAANALGIRGCGLEGIAIFLKQCP